MRRAQEQRHLPNEQAIAAAGNQTEDAPQAANNRNTAEMNATTAATSSSANRHRSSGESLQDRVGSQVIDSERV